MDRPHHGHTGKGDRCCHNGYKVMIELRKDELVYDIRNTAYVFADSTKGDNAEPHDLHNIYDVCEDGNMDKVARLMDSAVEDCKELLFSLTRAKVTGSGFVSDEWEEVTGSPCNDEDCYYLALHVPWSFSATSARTIMVYAHEYIVNRVLYKWMMLACSDGAQTFGMLAENARESLKTAAGRTALPIRIRKSLF